MRSSPPRISTRITVALAILTVVGTAGVIAFAWWAAARIDAGAVSQQQRALSAGLQEFADQLPIEQGSSTIWDDAVFNVRANNDAWLAENLVEWLSEYYGHDRVYVLDPDNNVLRAAKDGRRAVPASFEADRKTLEPLVQALRRQMSAASGGQADSTGSVIDLLSVDNVRFSDGTVGIVSARPIIPSTNAVRQGPGTEYLHISVRLLDEDVSESIAEKYALDDLRFDTIGSADPERTGRPVMDRAGRILGFYSWQPYRPALGLLQEMAPAIGGALVGGILLVTLLTRALRQTSAMLEKSEGNVSFLAFHDTLTGLPNRALFGDRLTQAFANARRTGAGFALHAIDLDRFKHVNDTLGHPAGDELIRQVSSRLTSLISEVDTAARIGGDEFAIIQLGVRSVEDALLLSQRAVAELQRPFDLQGQEAQIGASVGVVLSQHGTGDADDLLRQADVALYEAKTSGRGRYQVFAGELDLAVQERRAIELDLRTALNAEGGELHLSYQPIYGGTGEQIQGAEALVRWNSPRHGALSPAMFIPLAEERGLIDQLGLWVLKEACKFAVSSPLPWVAVNVSPLQFRSERFAERVLAVLKDVGLPPKRLELEVTEGLLLQSSPEVRATLNMLRAAGVRVALDDFGTGYSSISYLRTHGVDKLKIDQSFVAKLGQDGEISHIVRCIIDLASAMHMKVTAEGVETAEQANMLRKMGCDQLQGYLLSRPLSADTLLQLLSATTSVGTASAAPYASTERAAM